MEESAGAAARAAKAAAADAAAAAADAAAAAAAASECSLTQGVNRTAATAAAAAAAEMTTRVGNLEDSQNLAERRLQAAETEVARTRETSDKENLAPKVTEISTRLSSMESWQSDTDKLDLAPQVSELSTRLSSMESWQQQRETQTEKTDSLVPEVAELTTRLSSMESWRRLQHKKEEEEAVAQLLKGAVADPDCDAEAKAESEAELESKVEAKAEAEGKLVADVAELRERLAGIEGMVMVLRPPDTAVLATAACSDAALDEANAATEAAAATNGRVVQGFKSAAAADDDEANPAAASPSDPDTAAAAAAAAAAAEATTQTLKPRGVFEARIGELEEESQRRRMRLTNASSPDGGRSDGDRSVGVSGDEPVTTAAALGDEIRWLLARVRDVEKVGPGRHCSPRQRMNEVVTQETRVQMRVDDVAGNICPAPGEGPAGVLVDGGCRRGGRRDVRGRGQRQRGRRHRRRHVGHRGARWGGAQTAKPGWRAGSPVGPHISIFISSNFIIFLPSFKFFW